MLVRILVILGALASLPALAQPSVTIHRATAPIKLDGILDEPDWQTAELATNFKQYFPYDSSLANAQTEIRLTYDDQFIYIGALMHNLGPRKYVTPSLRRDYRGEANDGVSIVFDTFKDKTNAFIFGVNPYGVQREGLVANGGGTGSNDFTLNWDNKWYSEVKTYDEYWIAEMAIPFKTLRFKSNLSSWNVNFYRIDSQYAERSTWSPIPRNFDIVNLAFNKELIWDKPLEDPGANVSIIPYIANNTSRNFEKETPTESKMQFGGDAKIGIGPALNLDLTVNPDFSQVEVDEQVTNLDRFEIFFPERRQFFLENADLFANFGLDGTRPFFSRRIGVARDESTGQNIQNTIYGGVRLSGKINNNTRIGFLNMQTAEDEEIDLPSTNYTVGTIQQKVFARSNISMIVVNKQAFQDSIGGEFTTQPNAYSRLAGIDYNLASADNRWTGKAFYHHSFNELKQDSAFAFGGF
nr:carbohydrate binding family 9 domain-containing protein [Cyclobacteriaceae bacterium]